MRFVFCVSQLFGNINIDEESEGAINQHNNFRTFFQALMLLFRFVYASQTGSVKCCVCVYVCNIHFLTVVQLCTFVGVLQVRHGMKSCCHVWERRNVIVYLVTRKQNVGASSPTSTLSPSSSSVPFWWEWQHCCCYYNHCTHRHNILWNMSPQLVAMSDFVPAVSL